MMISPTPAIAKDELRKKYTFTLKAKLMSATPYDVKTEEELVFSFVSEEDPRAGL